MTRELRIGIALLVALGAVTAFLIVVGSIGRAAAGGRPAQRRGGARTAPDRWGSEELHVSGWYAELDGDCVGDSGGADPAVAWLQRDCPLRVLMPEQPPLDVTQEELLRDGIRLAAPLGRRVSRRAPSPAGRTCGGSSSSSSATSTTRRPRTACRSARSAAGTRWW